MLFSRQVKTLFNKEVKRFMKVWGQTITTPVLSSFLYLFIFGYSLGRQISMLEDFSYLEFIIPGLVIMGMINNSYQNTASSILTSKFHGNIHDLLVAPISHFEMMVAFVGGAIVRGAIVGLITFTVSLFFVILPMSHPFYLFSIALMTCIIFGEVGILAALHSESFDQMSMITNYVLMPLTYLSGIFYSIHILPPMFEKLSLANPLFYLVDAFRYGFLGIADVEPLISLGVAATFTILLSIFTVLVLKSGYGLRK
jgi:ABC-2 type transport system permease protein